MTIRAPVINSEVRARPPSAPVLFLAPPRFGAPEPCPASRSRTARQTEFRAPSSWPSSAEDASARTGTRVETVYIFPATTAADPSFRTGSSAGAAAVDDYTTMTSSMPDPDREPSAAGGTRHPEGGCLVARSSWSLWGWGTASDVLLRGASRRRATFRRASLRPGARHRIRQDLLGASSSGSTMPNPVTGVRLELASRTDAEAHVLLVQPAADRGDVPATARGFSGRARLLHGHFDRIAGGPARCVSSRP